MRVDSLREVVIVSHRERRIDVHRRGATGEWTTTEARGLAELVSIEAKLEVDEVYRDPLAP
jgi:Uma2 family endonuclease